MKERDLQRRIRGYFIARGCMVIKLTMLGMFGSAGMPDLLILHRGGRVLFIEVKAPGGKLTRLQRTRQQDLKGFGFSVHTVFSLTEAMELWDTWREGMGGR